MKKTLFDDDLTLEEAKELIKNGADVNEINQIGNTPIHLHDDFYIIQLLIDHGANVNHKNKSGITPLFYNNTINVRELLIKHGANVNAQNTKGFTLLRYVTDVKIARLLIKNAALPDGIEVYQYHREYFTSEQQKAFDTFKLLAVNDEQFFEMCSVYQNGIKNHLTIDITDMDII